jgi:6-pyruvoyltetrahydropterin/6-carboxytetrahydropterin synthase
MPYLICKTFEIENGHLLTKHPDKCKFPHGHTRKVEIYLTADDLDAHEMVCDFKIPKLVIGEYLDSLDHAMCINKEDPMYPVFEKEYNPRVIPYDGDPTTEVMAHEIYQVFKKGLKDYVRDKYPYILRESVRLMKVVVWETTSSFAEYWEDGREWL